MHRIKNTVTAMAFAGGLAWATAAQAGFVNEVPRTPDASASPSATVAAVAPPSVTTQPIAEPPSLAPGRKITQIGFRPSDIDVPRGKGRDVALADMLPVVVPRTFTIDLGSVDRNQLTTWSGGLPWDTVLADAIAPLPGIAVTIDWDRHLIALHRMASPQSTPSAPGATPLPAATASAPEAFELVGGQSLETQLQAWAKRAGWAITWNTPDDWIVPHDYAYGADFQEAVQKVFTQLADDGADVRADIWKGNDSVVVDKAGAHE